MHIFGHMLEPVFSPLYPIIATPGRGRTWSGLRTGVNYKLSAECNEAMDRLGADTAQHRPHLPRPHTARAFSEADKFIFHRFNYSPITAAPRVKFGVYCDRIGVFRILIFVKVPVGVSVLLEIRRGENRRSQNILGPEIEPSLIYY